MTPPLIVLGVAANSCQLETFKERGSVCLVCFKREKSRTFVIIIGSLRNFLMVNFALTSMWKDNNPSSDTFYI